MKNTNELIKKHESCILILEAIQFYNRRISLNEESINGFAGTFPRLKTKYLNDIDTIERCIKRLEQRYNNALNQTK